MTIKHMLIKITNGKKYSLVISDGIYDKILNKYVKNSSPISSI